MAHLIDKSAIVAEIERRMEGALFRQRNLDRIGQETCHNQMIANELKRVLSFMDTLKVKEVQEEPVSEDLEDFALQYAGHHAPYDDCMQEVIDAVKAGAKWQKDKQ